MHGVTRGQPGSVHRPCLDTYANIDKAGGDASHLSLPKPPTSPLFDKIPQAGIVGDDPMMMSDTEATRLPAVCSKWIVLHVGSRRNNLRASLQGCKGGINAQANLPLAGSAVRIYLAGRRARPIARKTIAGSFRPRGPGACFA